VAAPAAGRERGQGGEQSEGQRDRERVARERVERLQGLTATLAAAPDARAVAAAAAGYGASGELHRARVFSLTEDVPVRIEAVDDARKITALLPWIYDMVGGGLIEVQDTEVIKYSRHEPQAEEEHAMKHEKLEGSAKMLRIYIGEDDRWEGEPLHEAIVKKLRMMDVAGATVYRGVMGYGAQQRLHKRTGWLGLSTDLPIMISIIDCEEKIRRVLPVLDEMVDEGLVVLSDVEIIKYTHSHKSSDE
jgi:PII-like signaling protein